MPHGHPFVLWIRRTLTLIVAAACLVGCQPARQFNAVPEPLVIEATIPGMPEVRTWGDDVEDHFIESLVESIRQERLYHAASADQSLPEVINILTISGGGEDGAYGAGLLCGWTQFGNRPKFHMVTGISTGALTAPLAFLGPEYDHILREAYTTITVDDVMRSRGMLAILNRDGIADTDPLAKLVAKWVDDEALAAIATEHRKGRRLLIATVNLEAQRPVIWNMGAIAASGHPKAAKLFRQVMLASASIPGVFEPQYIEVEADGKRYEEMHVDGGTITQIFLWGAGVNVQEIVRRLGQPAPTRPMQLFVIRNGRFHPEYKAARPLFTDITGRAMSTLIKTQGMGDVFRLYVRSQQEEMDFFLAYIPPEFDVPYEEPFEPSYMNALFDMGYDQAVAGYPWEDEPPFMD